MRVSAHRGVGAGPEEHDMADRHLAGIAANDVPGRRRDRIEQDKRAKPLLKRRREHKRIGNHQREHHERPQKAPHHILPFRTYPSSLAHQALPIKPCGRNQRKHTNSEYTTLSLYTAPIHQTDSESMTPITSPAIS